MYIDPHVHMVSRTTDDYQRMALAGCVAITEPAFWAGYDRSSPKGFHDYFSVAHGYRTQTSRAIWHRSPHLALHQSQGSGGPGLRPRSHRHHPRVPQRANVLGIGEIGLNKNSRNELEILEAHLQLAADHDQMVLVHTPHLEDKRKGTRLIMDAIKNHGVLDPNRVSDRPRRGAHRPRRPRPRLLGRHDAVPRHQMHAAARRRHLRNARHRSTLDQLGRRLGPQRSAGRPQVPR